MAAKVLHFEFICLLHLFKYNVYSLDGENSSFLTNKDWRINSNGIYLFIAIFNMLL